jgi:hypothetical protein
MFANVKISLGKPFAIVKADNNWKKNRTYP